MPLPTTAYDPEPQKYNKHRIPITITKVVVISLWIFFIVTRFQVSVFKHNNETHLYIFCIEYEYLH